MDLLATLQSYLLYAIMLFSTVSSVDPDIMIRLQDLAGDAVSQGTLCNAEAEGSRPDWESWIVASAKRRTLCTEAESRADARTDGLNGLLSSRVPRSAGSPQAGRKFCLVGGTLSVTLEVVALSVLKQCNGWTARHAE